MPAAALKLKKKLTYLAGIAGLLGLVVVALAWLKPDAVPARDSKREAAQGSPPFVAHRERYAGSESCRQCHESHFTNFVQTSHYHTSSAPEEGLVKGHFSGERSIFDVRPGYRMLMKMEDGKHRQDIEASGFTPFHQEVDVVIGAGVYAQAFAGWESNRLVRLQAHYLTPADHWTLNPGSDAEVRRIFLSNRCMECHATYFEPDGAAPEFTEKHRSVRHNRDNFMLKMHCEKCHGPGQAHVDFFKQPREGVDFKKLIVNPAHLPRERQIQICGLCHSGVGELLAPSFTYQPGDDLDQFIRFDDNELDVSGLHSNNIHLLKKSRCFQGSETMTCSTCHDPHRPQRGDVKGFSQSCLKCHQAPDCPQEATLGPGIADNCIDCHMPKQPDDRFAYLIDGQTYRFDLRTHWIKPYPLPASGTVTPPANP